MVIVVLVLLGLCLGSFVNALVWRLHEQATVQAKQAKKGKQGKKQAAKELSVTRGRSMCPNCRHRLGFWDLIPVVSWLALRGRCRYCHKPISAQYPLVELATAGLFVLSYLCWPFAWDGPGIFSFVVWLPLLMLFMALTVYDLRWQLLPNQLVYPAGCLALGQVVVLAFWQQDLAIIWGALLGVAVLAGLFYGLFALSGGRWIGGGDVRLAVVIGLLVGGPLKVVMVLFLASVLGILAALPALVSKKAGLKQRVAFGPYLVLATIIVYLFGSALAAWYKQQFLLL